MLEVIALTVADAKAAYRGGADRIEVVGTMSDDGLSPELDVVSRIRDEVDIPIRVMLRTEAGFSSTEPDRLAHLAVGYSSLGVDGVVLGFLRDGHIDSSLVNKLVSHITVPYTFHRAMDNVIDSERAWMDARALEGHLTSVLTAGSSAGVSSGLARLTKLATHHADLMLVGGGLKEEHVPQLMSAGITSFHVGSAVRPARDFGQDIDPRLVEQWVAITAS